MNYKTFTYPENIKTDDDKIDEPVIECSCYHFCTLEDLDESYNLKNIVEYYDKDSEESLKYYCNKCGTLYNIFQTYKGHFIAFKGESTALSQVFDLYTYINLKMRIQESYEELETELYTEQAYIHKCLKNILGTLGTRV